MNLPPLSLYIHIPWCVQKCPYCDFNSHGLKDRTQKIPEKDYVTHLLNDLSQELHFVQGRSLQSIFIGGGTPSLLSADGIKELIEGVAAQIPFAVDIEITLEANPGTVEVDRFEGYKKAGVNRISIGIQSFNKQHLSTLGRIHNENEACSAAVLANTLNLNSFNVDLMHGLPNQTLAEGLDDLQQAISLSPPHLSWYQLTIEANTLFASKPPTLPEDELLWEIQDQGHQLLEENGYVQYEVSAYSKAGYQCKHNLNYWRFGDYLGIGCGAHGKITLPIEGRILRREKIKHPKGYMNSTSSYIHRQWDVKADERPFEYFLNRFRLFENTPKAEFYDYTGIDPALMDRRLHRAIQNQLIESDSKHWHVTKKGHLFLNDILSEIEEYPS